MKSEKKDGKLKCRDFVYKEGKTYEMPENEIELCSKGFHACHELYQVWNFYPHKNESIVYHEVECEGRIVESKLDDGKICCSKITIGKEVDSSKIPFFNWISMFFADYAKIQREDCMISLIDKTGKLIGDGNKWYRWCILIKNIAQASNGNKIVYINAKGNEFKTKEEAEKDLDI